LEFSDLVYPTRHSLLDYLGTEGTLYLDDYSHLKDRAAKLADEDQGWLEEKVKYHQLASVPALSNDLADLIKADRHAQLFGALFKKGMGGLRFNQLVELTSRPMQRFFGQMPLLKTELQRWTEQGQTVVILADG